MGGFEAATAVRRIGEGRYAADLDGDFGFAEALNGGYLMAVLGRAAVDASPHAHPIATAATFLRPAKPGPAELVVDTRKSGRTAATALVSLVQGGRPAVEALITTGTLDAAAEPAFAGPAPAVEVPPLAECTSMLPEEGTEGFAGQVDMRFDRSTMGWLDGTPSGRPEIRAWFRLRDEYGPDAFSLALTVDALPPVALNLGSKGWAPTVELTWHMRAVPAPGWLAVHGTGRLLSDGWFDEEVEVWDSAGRLVAQSRQIARVGIGAKK
ncbi:thioesterase family protein [Actinomadura opuntiae]|uniref:thioesterase family protein n=1 Tax=Actinomadura sp. OS1-43 TaxID=604315 RepID=UPI00255A9433|nr:thioesterase family protein [Actinomadura sp. OS1-43]MDL4821874.1 thioesterase family protein [Actinomadura sp. OS1-43]